MMRRITGLKRSLVAVVALAFWAPGVASGAPTLESIQAAQITLTLSSATLGGVLVGDGQTALVPALPFDSGRSMSVSRLGDDDGSVAVPTAYRVGGMDGAYVLGLAEALGPKALPLAESLAVGQHVFVVVGEDATTELAETTIQALTRSRFTVGALPVFALQGAPVVDAEGAVVGLITRGQDGVRAAWALSARGPATVRAATMQPLLGLRFGGEFGGLFDRALSLDLDLGMIAWDRFATLFRFGISVASPATRTLTSAADETGTVEEDRVQLRVGLELRYRQYLGRISSTPFYMDLAVGAQYGLGIFTSQGPRFFAPKGCDPVTEACPLRVDTRRDHRYEHAFAPSVGLDLRVGVVVVGYRFLPEALSYQQANTHRIVFGVTAF